jgi:membrane protein YdbS with pleckstrin-like domain
MTSEPTRRSDARRRPAVDPEVQQGPWGVLHAALAFLLEVAALAAFWYIGSRLIHGVGGLALGLGVAAVFVGVWAVFVAPRAPRRIPWPWRPVAALALFIAAGAGLLAVGQALGGAMIAVAVVDAGLAFWLRSRV